MNFKKGGKMVQMISKDFNFKRIDFCTGAYLKGKIEFLETLNYFS